MLIEIGEDKLQTGVAYNQYQLVGSEEGLYVFRNISN